MRFRETDIKDLLIVESDLIEDDRGYFFESYHQKRFEEAGITYRFKQDNQSRSEYGVIRGLHFQKKPYEQAKLVRVVEGSILDVAVDIRTGSDTYGKWIGVELSEKNKLQLMIPHGFAHGFSVLSKFATVFYKCDTFYHPESEGGIRYDDPALSINWQVEKEKMIISARDLNLPYLKIH